MKLSHRKLIWRLEVILLHGIIRDLFLIFFFVFFCQQKAKTLKITKANFKFWIQSCALGVSFGFQDYASGV